MITKIELRERLLKLRLAPSPLAKLAGMWPIIVSDWLNGGRELSSESLQRIEDTLEACEQLSKSVAVPVRWSDIGHLGPLILPLRKNIEYRHLHSLEIRELGALSKKALAGENR